MNMIPQIIIVVLILISIVFTFVKDGTLVPEVQKTYCFKYNMIGKIILIVLLTWGGFFDNLFTITFK